MICKIYLPDTTNPQIIDLPLIPLKGDEFYLIDEYYTITGRVFVIVKNTLHYVDLFLTLSQ